MAAIDSDFAEAEKQLRTGAARRVWRLPGGKSAVRATAAQFSTCAVAESWSTPAAEAELDEVVLPDETIQRPQLDGHCTALCGELIKDTSAEEAAAIASEVTAEHLMRARIEAQLAAEEEARLAAEREAAERVAMEAAADRAARRALAEKYAVEARASASTAAAAKAEAEGSAKQAWMLGAPDAPAADSAAVMARDSDISAAGAAEDALMAAERADLEAAERAAKRAFDFAVAAADAAAKAASIAAYIPTTRGARTQAPPVTQFESTDMLPAAQQLGAPRVDDRFPALAWPAHPPDGDGPGDDLGCGEEEEENVGTSPAPSKPRMPILYYPPATRTERATVMHAFDTNGDGIAAYLRGASTMGAWEALRAELDSADAVGRACIHPLAAAMAGGAPQRLPILALDDLRRVLDFADVRWDCWPGGLLEELFRELVTLEATLVTSPNASHARADATKSRLSHCPHLLLKRKVLIVRILDSSRRLELVRSWPTQPNQVASSDTVAAFVRRRLSVPLTARTPAVPTAINLAATTLGVPQTAVQCLDDAPVTSGTAVVGCAYPTLSCEHVAYTLRVTVVDLPRQPFRTNRNGWAWRPAREPPLRAVAAVLTSPSHDPSPHEQG